MKHAFEPLSTPRRSDGVFDQLRIGIFSGSYPPGSRLPNERELAEALQVNRGSVREALQRLEFLELVEVRHGQGAFVRELGDSSALQLVETLLRDPHTVTVDLLRQLLEFRRDVTLQVVGRAARNRSQAQMVRGRALLEREEEQGVDPAVALEIDVEMNALLGEATGNLMYQLVTNLFTKLIARLGPIYYNRDRDHRNSLETHRKLVDALEARDPDRARAIVSVMLDYSERKILEQAEKLESQGKIGPGRAPEAS